MERGERMVDYLPVTDMQYKDDLRKQRDDWDDIITSLDDEELLKNPKVKKAYDKAMKVKNRILESLQD